MERFSVKKPFTILVAVIAVIALGAVSLTHLSMDLLPELDLPYIIVITAYPGASPEKIEDQVTKPVENALGTINGIKNVSSTSSENYSIVQLEFVDDTDMNVATVRVSSALNELQSTLPEGTMTPNIMEISLDMLATMYVAVEREDYDIYQLTDFVNNDVIPYLSRQDGVASITTIGLVEKSIEVELNPDKIDELNDLILQRTDETLADAQAMLDEANEALEEAQEQLDTAQSSFGSMLSSSLFAQINGQAGNIGSGMRDGLASLRARLSDLQSGLVTLQNAQNTGLTNAQQGVDAARERLDQAIETQTQLQTILTEASALAEQTQAALDAVSEDPSILTDSEDYDELVQAAADAAAALLEAQLQYDEGAQELIDAQAAYDEANDALTMATLENAGISVEDLQQLISDIDTLTQSIETTENTINGDTINDLIETTRNASSLMSQVSNILARVREADPAGSLNDQIGNVSGQMDGVNSLIDSIPALLSGLQTATTGLTQAQLDAAVSFSTATVQLSDAQTQLDQAQAQYDAAKKTALESANADALIDPNTLSQIIYAQNFSMPVGYIDDENDDSWLLRVGEEFGSAEEIASSLLIDNDIIGTVRLEDIADITIIDTADQSYTKLNGSDGIILCVYKSSSSGTNEVSGACNKALEELSEIYPGFHSINLVDQGDYINMIVGSVFQSMGVGALLAIVVLALFLKDVKPTIVVAISIPLSVLLAIVFMYFTGLDLNMMTLSGLSLGIGMLVDNSVVVMENIFRLINKGLPAPRAAVQGAKQVRGSIIASTLTTICVFFPSVFATGMVKTLLYPLALSIGYCLVASLGIALTVVPASCSTLLRRSKPKEHKLFDKILNVYGRSLRWCLRFKVVPLLLSIVLLAFSVYEIIVTGIVYIPEILTNEIAIDITTPEEMTREESYATVDDVMNRILAVDGVIDLGIMDAGSASSFLMSGVSSDSYGSYTCNALAPENVTPQELARIADDIESSVADLPCVVTVTTGSALGDLSSMMGSSGVSVTITGNNYEELERISNDVREIFETQEGVIDVTDSFEAGAPTLQVIIDRDKAMEYGLTVAQIYMEIASHTSTSVNATSVTIEGTEMTVSVIDNTDSLTRESLLDIEFEEVDMTGGASGSFDDMAGQFSGFTGEDDEDSADEEDVSDEDAPETDEEEEEEESRIHKLSEFAEVIETTTSSSIYRENLVRYVTVSSSTAEGYNTTLIARSLTPRIEEYAKTVPDGYSVEISGESTEVTKMVTTMAEMAALGLLFIYLIMVAQFQSLLSPFIILFTVPLAFTGGMLGLVIAGEQLSMLSLLGFVILMGTVVNNGIVFVDYANRLRIGGLERRDALVATGMTRMRPILMTALTTILAMSMMIFGSGMASQLGRGMSIVIAGGLLYATFMTLYIVPVMYDILFKRQPLNVDVGSDIDEELDDAAEFLQSQAAQEISGAKAEAEAKAEENTSEEPPANP